MSEMSLNYLEALIELSRLINETDAEFTEFLSNCPDDVKEAYQIIKENRPNYLKQLPN